MAKNKKYYVVWDGVTPGIYDNWEDCKLQITGYPNARYRAYKTLAEAESAYSGVMDSGSKKTKNKQIGQDQNLSRSNVIWDSIAVDAACSGNPGVMEYQGVQTRDGTQLFHQGPFKQGTNNIGEYLALVHALALLKKEGKHDTPIYTDSRTALAWVRNKRVKTTLKRTHNNAILFNLVKRATVWLENNTYNNPILKWDTKNWGEIPADFGRK